MDNSVNSANTSNRATGGGVFSKVSGTYVNSAALDKDAEERDTSYMSFDSYLQLIVAQMQNQDFNNPMDDSEVLAQMAQYSMLEGIKNMTQQSGISYATSLVGRAVTVDGGSDGLYTGVVQSITVTDGEPYLMIDGVAYKTTAVTDIVANDMYRYMVSLVGKTVRLKNSDDPESAPTGVISNFVFQGGEAKVVVNGEIYPVSSLEFVDTGDKTEGAEENGDKTEDDTPAEDDGETVTETAEAEAAASMSTYQLRTESLIDSFMKELDEAASGVSAVTKTSETDSIGSTEEYTVEMFQLEVPDYAAGIFGDNETATGSIDSETDKTFASGSGTLTRDYSDTKINRSNSYNTEILGTGYSYGKSAGVTTEPGVSSSDCVPHRISVEAYPEEAALADRLGTRMYDIRFINNHAITSRIKTGEVIGHSSSGKPVTEIGYSGVGQLGEVVTFADGTQRVEVLLKNGHSTWLNTSGKYTLDEICTKNGKPGSLAGKLTSEESVIRHFSDPFSEMDQSLKNSFERYIKNI